MRYTTIIDISEIPAVYRNINTRLVYLHLVLKSGYHDDDRDVVSISLRRIASDLNLSLAAVRHAIAQLEKANLLTRQGPIWVVKKWIIEQPISKRAKTQRQQKAIDLAAERRAEQEKRDREAAIERQRREQLQAQGKTSFMVYFEGLRKKAAAGDSEAAESVKRWQSTYDKQAAAMAAQAKQSSQLQSP